MTTTVAAANRFERPTSGPTAVRALRFAAFLSVATLAVNAVLIQTIIADASSPLKNLIRAAVFALATFVMLWRRSLIPPWLFGFVLWSLFLFVLRSNPDQLSFVFVFALVALLWSIPERSAMSIFVVSSLAALGLVFGLLALGITHNTVLAFRNRSTFGTQGVPFFFNVVYGAATMTLLYVARYRPRSLWMVAAALLVATTFLFRATDARGGYIAFLIFLAMLVVVPIASRVALFRWSVAAMPLGFTVLAFMIALLHDNDVANKLLSNRPIRLAEFLDHVNLLDTFLSSSVKQFDQAASYVGSIDNSYLHLVVGGGIAITALYLGAFAKTVTNLFHLRRYPDIAFLVSASAYFNSESILLRIENPFVICCWYLVLRFARRDLTANNAPTTQRRSRRS